MPGPTPGMGAYAPLPWLPDAVKAAIVADVVEPVAAELVRRGCGFSGLLYAGLAMTSSGPAVVNSTAASAIRRPRRCWRC